MPRPLTGGLFITWQMAIAAPPSQMAPRVSSELAEAARKFGMSPIETKNPDAAPSMEQELLRLMRKYELIRPAARNWQVLIQSFSTESLIKIHRLKLRRAQV